MDLQPSISISGEKLRCPQAVARRLQSSISHLSMSPSSGTDMSMSHTPVGLVSSYLVTWKLWVECLSPKAI